MQPIDSNSFAKVFRDMDDAAGLGYPEVAAILRATPDYVCSIKSKLPKPAHDEPRFVRWTAGQIRAWQLDKAAQAGAGEGGSEKRHGRPRKSAEIPKAGAA